MLYRFWCFYRLVVSKPTSKSLLGWHFISVPEILSALCIRSHLKITLGWNVISVPVPEILSTLCIRAPQNHFRMKSCIGPGDFIDSLYQSPPQNHFRAKLYISPRAFINSLDQSPPQNHFRMKHFLGPGAFIDSLFLFQVFLLEYETLGCQDDPLFLKCSVGTRDFKMSLDSFWSFQLKCKISRSQDDPLIVSKVSSWNARLQDVRTIPWLFMRFPLIPVTSGCHYYFCSFQLKCNTSGCQNDPLIISGFQLERETSGSTRMAHQCLELLPI